MSKEREPASGALEGARRATGGGPGERGGTAAPLSGGGEQSLVGMEANLKAREADVENEETQRLKSLVADLSMSNELLREKIHRMEAGRPLAWRRSTQAFVDRYPSYVQGLEPTQDAPNILGRVRAFTIS